MKLDPMPMLRVSATLKINERFNAIAATNLHRDHAYRRKREVANAVMRSESLDAAHPFAREARMRGISVRELADVVAAKADTIDQREGERQRLLLEIEAATTPDAITAILATISD